jgi:excinuclease ABC subunit A
MTKGRNKSVNHKTHILIQGARVHNLKNIDVAIPRNKMVVVTGLSGSGKSSLAFDTLYAEGQRRYVESLSSYARQFMGRFDKPDVDQIKGISPAIAIEQKVISRNPRSTVGTTTEIYDYLKLLYSRVGKTHSPISGELVKKDSVTDVVNYINSFDDGEKVILMTKVIVPGNRDIGKHLELLLDQGYIRIKLGNKVDRIEKVLQSNNAFKGDIYLVVDRFSVEKSNEENNARIGDSAQNAFVEGVGECIVETHGESVKSKLFSNKFEKDGIQFEEPSLNFFSFNNPMGACPKCEGFGKILGIDKDLVIPNKNLSVYDQAIVCWKGEKMGEWLKELTLNADKFDFPIHRPYHDLDQEQKDLLWTGNKFFSGLDAFFKYLESKMYKIQYRVMISRYRGKTVCTECKGSRLRKETNYVTVSGKTISEISGLSIKDAIEYFEASELDKHDAVVAKRLFLEIKSRLQFLSEVGLDYLSLDRLSNSLSGGESQRINLATSLGSSLVGSMYILDEPSIGLHPRDTGKLVGVLESLRDLGNTVVIVEHEEEIMNAADEIIDMGPMAGAYGGEVVFQGTHADLIGETESLTARYLTNKLVIPVPEKRRKWNNSIHIKSARENNLKGIDVEIPLNTLTCITGVSGSGKSSLVKKILYPSLKKMFGGYGEKTGVFEKLEGDFSKIHAVEYIDQNPIGKSSRSNPVTYVKAYDDMRALFADQQLSKINGYKAKHFSFNVEGGRCDECEGEGFVTIEMQFMADVKLKCENCEGQRFKDEVLEVRYNEKNIFDILSMSIDEAVDFFGKGSKAVEKRIVEKIAPLQEIGLGYVQLGQSSSTLSGGEAQRIKLASFLSKGVTQQKTLFIFDEPTTGLHFHDIDKLLKALNALIGQGHSVVVIEHNIEVIKCADWVLDLGPEGGIDGGHLLFAGTPEDLVKCKESYTAQYLGEKLLIKQVQ